MEHTKVFMIPPSGFRLSLIGSGYVNNETGANFAVSQSTKSISSIKNHLSEKYLLSKNYRIIEIKKYWINGYTAYWYEVEDQFVDKTVTKFILVIGNKDGYAMIEAFCPKEYPLAAMAIKKSIFSVYYDADSIQIKRYNP